MKKIIAALFAFLMTMTVFAQFNQIQGDHQYCSHLNRYSKQGYYEPVRQNPLLDDYDMTFYFLDLEVSDDTTKISGNVTLHARVSASVLDTFAFELVPEMEIDSVLINNVPVSFSKSNNSIIIPRSVISENDASTINLDVNLVENS